MRRLTVPLAAAAVSLVLVAGCSSSQPTSTSAPPASASPSVEPSSSSTTAPSDSKTASEAPDSNDVVANPPSKSWKDALKAAQENFSGDVSKIELESKEGGGLEYKVELISKSQKYAVQYDANTLNKLSEKRENLGSDAAKKRKKTFDPDAMIGLDQAAKTAREQQDGTITKWKIEGKDSGRTQYEFDIAPAGSSDDTEVQIDAKDGSVIQDS